MNPQPDPGYLDAGVGYLAGTLRVTYSATFSAYIEVYPDYDAEEFEGYADGYYMTATNRTQKGVEFLARFRRDMGSDPDGWIQIFDWSCSLEYPCDNGYPVVPGTNAFVRAWHLPDVPCWYEMLEDNRHYVNYVFFRNSTWIVEPRNPPADPPLWRNSVSIFNTCTRQYDGVYVHDYAANQLDCSTNNCGWWAGIAERFPDLSTKPPTIAKMGFHHQELAYDGHVTRLHTGVSYWTVQQPPYWQEYALFPNDTYEVGTYQDDDGDDIPNPSDHDIDGDGVNNWDGAGNSNETQCGATAGSGELPEYNPYVRPERIDGVFSGTDDDLDGSVDEPLPSGAANRDCDGDGYNGGPEASTPLCGNGINDDGVIYGGSDDGVVDDGCPGGPGQVGLYSEAQFNIGLADQDPCGTDGWPSDLASGGIPDSTNRVNIADINSFLAPRRLNTSPGHPNFNARWDLSPGMGIYSDWINIADLNALLGGTSGYPPMLDEQRAYDGPPCPWPP